ncbi:MAG: LemA family protein [bacterium]|nr:LemA family protein [bacterium]
MRNKIILIFVIVLVVLAAWSAVSHSRIVAADALATKQWLAADSAYAARFARMADALSSTDAAGFAAAVNRYVSSQGMDTKALAAADVEAEYAQAVFAKDGDLTVPSSLSAARLEAVQATDAAVSAARGSYNEAVRVYNTSISGFPGSVVARMFGYGPRTYLRATDGF